MTGGVRAISSHRLNVIPIDGSVEASSSTENVSHTFGSPCKESCQKISKHKTALIRKSANSSKCMETMENEHGKRGSATYGSYSSKPTWTLPIHTIIEWG